MYKNSERVDPHFQISYHSRWCAVFVDMSTDRCDDAPGRCMRNNVLVMNKKHKQLTPLAMHNTIPKHASDIQRLQLHVGLNLLK